MSNFTSQNNVLDLAAKPSAKNIKSSNPKAETSSNGELTNTQNGKEPKSFLANLIQAIDETNEFLPKRLQISEEEIVQEFMFKIEKGNLFGEFGDEEKISIFENLSFMQILGVLENLQIQNFEVKLANLSTQTQQFLQTQSNLDSLKEAKSLNELLNLAKSLNLEVSNIKIDRLTELQSTFPNLNKANFFSQNIETVFKDFLNNKISNIIKESGISKEEILNSKNKNAQKQDISPLSKLLKETTVKTNDENQDDKPVIKTEPKTLLDKDTQSFENKEIKPKTVDLSKEGQETVSKNERDIKQEKANPIKELSSAESKSQPKSIQNVPQNEPTKEKFLTKQDDKVVFSNPEPKKELPQESKKLALNSDDIKKQTQNTSAQTRVENLEKQPKSVEPKENKTAEIKTDKEVKSDEKNPKGFEKAVIEDKKENKTVETKTTDKELKTEPNKELKIEQNKIKDELKNTSHQELKAENANKELKTEPNKELMNSNNTNAETKNLELFVNKIQNKALNSSSNSNEFSQNSNEQNRNKEAQSNKEINLNSKEDNNELNSLLKDLTQVARSEVKNQVNLKETFTQFSQDLKEQLSNYKPPITRFNLTLNPSNLGEVEVTLIQRGNNLHISFHSNTNTMNLFVQNQAEFKNSLVNMGFTGLEMNFSDQSKKDRQQQGKNRNAYNFKEENETLNANNTSLEMILAKYF